MNQTVTIIVPEGYASGEEFAKDCGFEIVQQISEDLIEKAAQALANDYWHPPQPLKSLAKHDADRFRRQARVVLMLVCGHQQIKQEE